MARKVNDAKPQWVIDKVKIAIADFLQANPDKTAKDVTIACYGLAFKADIDDLRESPALNITEAISKMHSGRVIAVEPNISILPSSLANVDLSALFGCNSDIKVVLVKHKEFIENYKTLFSTGTVINTCSN